MEKRDQRAKVGVDVGGTFTDLVMADASGIRVAKVPSTPHDQTKGILAGIDRADIEVAALHRFAHGTTVATNTVLERDGARTVLVLTAGFKDLLTIGRQDRPHLYDLGARRPAPVVDASFVVEADERIAPDGVVVALTATEVDRVVEQVAALEPEAVAVSLLFAFLDPSHEQQLAAALRQRLNVPVTTASELLPVFRELERTSTAALNAYVAPRIGRYLNSLSSRLSDAGLKAPVEVMRSGGGTFTADVAAREPVHTLLSGPAAGAWGAAAVAAASGIEDVIAFDVGGTSTDVTLVRAARPTTTGEGAIDGLPFAITTTDIHTIGSGGGSIAWRDDGGALRVGPRSAGAVPGPAAYDQGGVLPTVTDANVVLGRLDPHVQLGGAMPMRADLARNAIEALAGQLNLGMRKCAKGIVRVADAQMAKALRVVSVEQGHDPRQLTLVPFGGAGGLHQAALTKELGCRRVLVPPNPGVLSALGLLGAPVTVDRARTRLRPTDTLHRDELAGEFLELENEATRTFKDQDIEVVTCRRSADLRYRGQAFELEVPVDDHHALDPEALTAAFHQAHLARYGYEQPHEGVELVTLRVRLEGAQPKLPLHTLRHGGSVEEATLATRPVVDEDGEVDARIVDRSRLGAGATVHGPVVLVGIDATVWIAPWQHGEVDEHGVVLLTER